ncbi:type I phosphodiesterase/nucleotide pyrophosphatase [Barrientosiimonas humi]|uniref:Type I phosphodiesterase/nucleotide pyrophosphatase n=1 Tax=Barrientosiimonas humi TaxID=999931 RepID=A0A542XAX6_9MICO|nr:nucleotide pyrophosphatase/phosphodiesterase family protein [Barrientosiimonas humi]TQL32967.1 type I phosphodiesterase/nucleotide pyrophosphatase [Barrientosiimonas humi]CAG7572957.1 hypothetical protein BH39T_PBIAJDOK_01581 [Barrientosiimonas humi]
MTDAPTPLLPRYDSGGLAGVLPRVVGSLGVRPKGAAADVLAAAGAAPLPPARRAVVVLVDGLGLSLLEQRRGHAPFLRSLLGEATPLTAGFPATTATSMGSFGTGLPPGAHGLTGYQVRDPDTGRLFNELSWEDGPRPERWQPDDTWLQRATRGGVATTMVGPAYFDGSGLTRAALRGATFAAADDLPERVDAALAAVRAGRRALVYLYWGEVDRVGHELGVASPAWGAELERVDAELRRLHGSLPPDCSLTVVADHGMVDVPLDARVDVAHDLELAAGVEVVGGDPRAAQLYCLPGAADDVRHTWAARFGDLAWVRTREQAVADGWFGAVAERVLPRIGEVLVAFHAAHAVVDSRVMREPLLSLVGQHGSLTEAELTVPMLHLPAARPA